MRMLVSLRKQKVLTFLLSEESSERQAILMSSLNSDPLQEPKIPGMDGDLLIGATRDIVVWVKIYGL